MRQLVLAFLLFMGACTGHYGVASNDGRRIDGVVQWAMTCTDFSGVTADFIRDGFSYWEEVAGRPLFVELPCLNGGDAIAGVIVHRVDRDYFDGTLGYESDNVHLGFWSGEIALLPPWFAGTDWTKRQVIRHEVGHLLGFDHVDDPGCIMNAEAASDEACGSELDTLRRIYQ